MVRVQKQVSLLQPYWDKLESLIDEKYIRTRGDALMSVIDKVFPDVVGVERPANTTESHQNNDRNMVLKIDINEPKVRSAHAPTVCECGHANFKHIDKTGVCSGKNCNCKIFRFSEENTDAKEKEYQDAISKKKQEMGE